MVLIDCKHNDDFNQSITAPETHRIEFHNSPFVLDAMDFSSCKNLKSVFIKQDLANTLLPWEIREISSPNLTKIDFESDQTAFDNIILDLLHALQKIPA